MIDPNEIELETLECFRALGIIRVEEEVFVKCSNESDSDYLDRADLGCIGEITIGDREGDYYCPECGRPINDVPSKKHFQKYTVSLDPNGIEVYVKNALNSISNIKEIESKSRFVFNVIMVNDKSLEVVIPPYSEIRYQYSGLSFAEPILYIIPSPIQGPVTTVLEERQNLGLVDLLTYPIVQITERVEIAAIPIEGRKFYSDLDDQFDEMMERHKDRDWQFFEQGFIPTLTRQIVENPELSQRYLDKLRRLNDTIFGEFYVPIGGSGKPDLVPIRKFELMNALIRGNLVGDAKFHRSAKLRSSHIGNILLHLERSKVSTSVVFVANDKITADAWMSVIDLFRSEGEWKIIILTKYMLLEIINELDAYQVLEL